MVCKWALGLFLLGMLENSLDTEGGSTTFQQCIVDCVCFRVGISPLRHAVNYHTCRSSAHQRLHQNLRLPSLISTFSSLPLRYIFSLSCSVVVRCDVFSPLSNYEPCSQRLPLLALLTTTTQRLSQTSSISNCSSLVFHPACPIATFPANLPVPSVDTSFTPTPASVST